MAGAAGDDTLTVLSTDEEGTLLEAGNDGDAGCVLRYAVWNALIGGGHDLVENFVGGLDTLIELGGVFGTRGHGRDDGAKGEAGDTDELCHCVVESSCGRRFAAYLGVTGSDAPKPGEVAWRGEM